LTGPAVGEPDPGRAARSRTGLRDAAGGLFLILALGLACRIIIAFLVLPGSGFGVDIGSFQYWAQNLASEGLAGFYDRPFFHDYTPGYLYVLWVIGKIGELFGGGVGDLIKIPPILADVALAGVVWSMARELGASNRAAWLGALLVIVNPVTWLDSSIWGQVDSVGTLVMLLALRELWHDHPERSAILAMLAALIKPQLAILIPIVAVVVIRRALWPDRGYGNDEPPPDRSADEPAWTRGPVRIFTTALAGLATALALALPFGLSLPGLIVQVFKTAAGYPYLTVNAYNPWALVSRDGQGVAANAQWICDTTVQPTGPIDIRLGDFVLWHLPASTVSCPDGYMVGAIPAVLVGAGLFLVTAIVTLLLVARRPDRRTMLVGLAVLAIAFFVLPTRVHERYLYPFVAVGAILAAASIRWRIAYVISAVAMAANMYAILTWTELYQNPGISDWLGIRPALASFGGVAAAAIAQLIVFAWAFSQLRDDRLDELADDMAAEDQLETGGASLAHVRGATAAAAVPAPIRSAAVATPARSDAVSDPAPDVGPAHVPVWDEREGFGTLGPVGWFMARFHDRPIRADRSASLHDEPGGRIDKLDIWILVVLVISLLTVRLWRLAEPYGMHFDEVYHARTATEFLQDWRYGISHDIYEWTHPHLAKYAMAVGLVVLGDDQVGATSDLGTPVTDAAIEPRWDNAQDHYQESGDRLWVATGSEVRAYDLKTRALVATIPLPGATAVAVDRVGHRVFVGTTGGDIQTIDTLTLDAARNTHTAPAAEALAFTQLDGPIQHLFMPDDGSVLAAVEPGTSGNENVVIVDPKAAAEVGRASLRGVTQLADGGAGRIAIAEADGVAFIDTATGTVQSVVTLGGPAMGISATAAFTDNPPLYASYQAPDGPRVATITTPTGGGQPVEGGSFVLPGATAGPVFFDLAARMVHVVGSVPGSPTNQPTVYVVEPHANAVYADAALPFTPKAIVLDDNEDYPSTDRQQLLALAPNGAVASVATGLHAWAWRVPGVLAGVAMAALLYLLARLLFRRRSLAVILGFLMLTDGMLFAQSRIGMNDSYVGLGIVAAYTLFVALWLRPGNSRRHWIAFAIGMPILGLILGLALASKWVAAYAIGGLGILVLARSALGRLLLTSGLIGLTTVLGYIAISVPVDNYLFLILMVAVILIAVVANVLHPVAWTGEEERFAIGVPIVAGAAIVLAGMSLGAPEKAFKLGPLHASPLELGFLCFVAAAAVYSFFVVIGRFGLGPRARRDPAHDELLEPPSPAPVGWLRLGSGFGLPVIWTLVGLVVIPLFVYVISYIPWAMVEGHQLWGPFTIFGIQVAAWPPGHAGQTLTDLTGAMYQYHNSLSAAHPASSPWWAWPFDFKPVWFYEQSFAGGTSASIYDAGNLVAWWLGIPAMAFIVWQAFKRRSTALAMIAIGFACQWISWARIDRAAFQYHYYTALPFLLLALAYFVAELWNGPSPRTWLLARIAAAAAILAPFGLWLFGRPLCGFVRVTDVNPGSLACPTYIPDLALSPRTLAIAIVVGIGVLLLVRVLLSFGEPDESDEAGGPADAAEAGDGPNRGGGFGSSMRDRILSAGVIAVGVSIAFAVASTVFTSTAVIRLTQLPVEPLALIVTLALLPVAAFVATARDARRFAAGLLGAIGLWFMAFYPNISALPLPSAVHNAYQGLLPTYVYPFQFPVATGNRTAPSLADPRVLLLLAALVVVSLAIGYSAWTWRIALAERRAEDER
jgi:hypothetical protein